MSGPCNDPAGEILLLEVLLYLFVAAFFVAWFCGAGYLLLRGTLPKPGDFDLDHGLEPRRSVVTLGSTTTFAEEIGEQTLNGDDFDLHT